MKTMKMGCQIYVKGSVEAVDFYCRAFNLTIGMNFKGPDGTYVHAALTTKGTWWRKPADMLAVAEDGRGAQAVTQDGQWPVMSFDCWGLSREAVDQAWRVLSEGALSNDNPDGPGPVPWNEYCFNVVDKFGVYWWVAI